MPVVLPVVMMDPDGQMLGAPGGVGTAAGVDPLEQAGLDEVLGLAVGTRAVSPKIQ